MEFHASFGKLIIWCGNNSFIRPSFLFPCSCVDGKTDHMQLNEDLGQEVPFSEATNATIEMLQEPEISLEAGLAPDDMIDQLGNLLARYEIPIGLTNKLMMLSEFASLEFIIDDSRRCVQWTMCTGNMLKTCQKG